MTDSPTAPHPSGPAPLAAEAEDHLAAGDLAEAARVADALLADPDEPGGPAAAARAAHVLAAVLAHRGMLARAAELHAWVAESLPAHAEPGGAVALVGAGRETSPAEAPATPTGARRAPGLRAGGDALLVDGVAAAVRPGASSAALSQLVRAAGLLECAARSSVWLDSPAVLAALVALHRGEPEIAAPVLDRAIAADLGGIPFRRRHRLWRAWVAMAQGDVSAARAGRAEAMALPGDVPARDALVDVALEAGLARRLGDTRALLALWSRAREAVLGHAVDLYALLPLGELLVVAARLGRTAWLAPHAAEGDELLATLGRPALFAGPWHWSGLLAAVVAEDPAAAGRHAARLAEAGATETHAAVLADGARTWLAVLGGDVDPVAVAEVATHLRDAGSAWDGARLCKEAAVRTTDRKAIGSLLGTARVLLPAPGAPVPSASADPVPACDIPEPARGPLSDREREVAELLLEGMTYRQIGDRLFIAAKTVEHHVGRMRQRLGSGTRTDLFTDLRASLETAPV